MKIQRGKILRELRNSKGLNQSYFAEMLGISLTAYQKYEHGTAEPNFDNLIKLADFYGVTTDYLLGRAEMKPSNNTKDDIYSDNASINDFTEMIMKEYIELTKQQQQIFLDFTKKITEKEIERQANLEKKRRSQTTRTGDIVTDDEAKKDA